MVKQASGLKPPNGHGHTSSTYTQEMGQFALRDMKAITLNTILGHQQPAS